MRPLVWLSVVGLSLCGGAWAEKTWSEKEEKRAGDEALKQILSQAQAWDSADQLARCQKMAEAIAAQSGRPEVKYDIRLVTSIGADSASGQANALTLPGGYIIVTRGLVDPSAGPEAAYLAVQSDDELASVLGHEIAHNCLYHGLKQAERNEKFVRGGLIAALAGLLLGGGTSTAFGALGMANYVRMGVLSHYSIEYEIEADRAAVACLAKTPYSPVGLLTFMERLAAQDRARPGVELGIEQTHPYPVERVQMLRRAIVEQGLDINRRAVTTWKRAEAVEAVVYGQPAWIVMLWERPVCTFRATSAAGEAPAQRAQAAVERLNEALAKGMAEFDIRVSTDTEGPCVTVMGERLMTVLPGDLDDPGQPPAEGAAGVAKALRVALFGDTLTRQIKAE